MDRYRFLLVNVNACDVDVNVPEDGDYKVDSVEKYNALIEGMAKVYMEVSAEYLNQYIFVNYLV